MTELVEHGQLFIGGELTDPLGSDVIEVISPAHRAGHRPRPARVPGGRGPGRRRRAQGLRRGPWARATPEERIEVVTRIKDAILARHEEIARIDQLAERLPVLLERARPGARRDDGAGTRPSPSPANSRTRKGDPARSARLLVRREPVGVVGGRRAVERPAVRGRGQARPRAAHRLLGGPQAVARDAAGRLHPGRDRRGGRAPEGVLSILPADREVSEYLVAHPGVDKVAFTGSDRRRQARHGVACGEQPQARHPGARRQVGRDHPAGRRPRGGHRGPQCPPPA